MHKLVVTVLFLLSACSSTLPPAGDNMGKHFRFSDELRSVMRRMDGLVHERELTASEIRQLQVQQAESLSRVASELRVVTDQLLLEPGGPGLAQREEFRTLAAALGNEVSRVQAAAAVGDNLALRAAFGRIETACNNCHVRYRAL